MARHRATDPAHRLGVLLADAGGPGSSGAEIPLSPGYFGAEIRARFDIVGFDLRGTGRTDYIDCETTPDDPGDEPADQAEFDALRARNRQLVADCRARNLPVFDHADTATNARDLDAVRRALGEDRISFHGASYGTLLGQQYAERYGDHVRAMVLDGVIDHSVDLAHFVGDRAAAVDELFGQFTAWCARTATCALHGRDVLATWRRAQMAADGMPFPHNWLRDQVYADMRVPDWDDVARVIADTAAGTSPVRAEFTPNYEAVRLAVVCQDFDLWMPTFARYSAMHAEELRRSPIMRGSTIGHGEATACLGVAGPPANPPHRLNVSKAPRILLLSSRYDPATPYAWAVNAHRQAPANTTLLTYEGSGHGAYRRTPCTLAAVDGYLLTPKTPRHDFSCPA
ncbi:alpha/beta hydrolase [Amycolatopsis sp. NPDC005961]|uniref:alpha/beta hydrolase n=1 Tax=Amycolatopsis sp. NPDC005961 TaxID=3156720 RepID=UPI00340B8239